MRKAKRTHLKAVPELTLHEQMTELFREGVAQHIKDPRKKRFFVAFLLALPKLSPYDMDRMEMTLVTVLGGAVIDEADREAT